jgi:hypothetical protein
MNSSIRNLLAGAVMAMGTQTVWAQSDTATADATVTVVTALTVQKDTDLNFGTVVRPQTADLESGGYYVSIGASGDRFSNVTSIGGGATAATFTVSGEGTLAYTPTVTVAPVDTSSSGLTFYGDVTARCGSLAPQGRGASSLALGSCALTNGTSTVNVGGSMDVLPASEGPFDNGAVSLGTITVVVAYN